MSEHTSTLEGYPLQNYPIYHVSLRKEKDTLKKEDKQIDGMNVLGLPDLYRRVRSFSGSNCLNIVSKAIRNIELADVRHILYASEDYISKECQPSVPCLIKEFGKSSKIPINDSNFRICELKDDSRHCLTDLWKKYSNISDLAVVMTQFESLKGCEDLFFEENTFDTPLKSIWITTGETYSPTTLAFRRSDGENISFSFLFLLLSFIRNMSCSALMALAKKKEFQGLRCFSLSKKDFRRLHDCESSDGILERILGKCPKLRTFIIPGFYMHRHDICSRFRQLVELRIGEFEKTHGLTFDINSLPKLKVLDCQIDGSFPMTIANPSLRTVVLTLTKADECHPILIDECCIFLENLKLENDAHGWFNIALPSHLPSINMIWLRHCLPLNDVFQCFRNYSQLKKLTLYIKEDTDRLVLPSNLAYLEELTIDGAHYVTIRLPRKMPLLKSLTLCRIFTMDIQIPIETPQLSVLKYNSILLSINELMFPTLAINLTNFELCDISLTPRFILPNCFPNLQVCVFKSCELAILILPQSNSHGIRVQIVDCIELCRIADRSIGQIYDVSIQEESKEVPIIVPRHVMPIKWKYCGIVYSLAFYHRSEDGPLEKVFEKIHYFRSF